MGDYDDLVKRVFELSGSNSRGDLINRLVQEEDIGFVPRPREDFEKIYIIADYDQSKNFIPSLRFNYILGKEIYVSSQSVTRIEDRKKLLTNKVYKILNNNLKNKLITFLGVTFKPNTDDMREASSLYMIPKLLKKGAIINYFDPSGKKNEFKKFKRVKYCKNVSQACLRSDLILLHTEWNEFKTLNFKKLIKKSNFKVFDMRNLYSPKSMKKKGINYFGVGR